MGYAHHKYVSGYIYIQMDTDQLYKNYMNLE